MASSIKWDFPNRVEDQVSRLVAMRQEGQRWQHRWGRNWDRNVGIIRGNLWPKEYGRPLFLANLISPTVRRKAGLLVEAKPGIDVRPRKGGLQKAAEMLRRTIEALLSEQNAAMTWETLSYHLAAFGHGFWKIGYDPEADFGLGGISMQEIDSRRILVDPLVLRAIDLWKAQYLVEESIVPYSWVQAKFPKTVDLVKPDTTIRFEDTETHQIGWFRGLLDRIKARGGKAVDDLSAVPRVYLQEFWVADATIDGDGNLLYPGGRRIFLTGDEQILNPNAEDPSDLRYGQANPYWDGLLPYVMLDNQPDLDHPFGQDEVEALRRLNEAFNSVGHMTTRTMVKNVPWIIADSGSITADTLQDIKELEEVVIEKAPGRTVTREAPTQPTATNLAFMQLMITLVEMYAGLNDGALQGRGRIELRSQSQIEGLANAAQVLIRAQARRLENMIERGGQLLISRIFQYYTDDRLLAYADGNAVKEFQFQKAALRDEIVQQTMEALETEAFEETKERMANGESLSKAVVEPEISPERILLALRGAWKLFRFKVIPFSTLASTKLQRAMILEQLALQGVIPQSMVVKEAGFDNPEELQLQAAQEMKKRVEMGFPPPAPPRPSRKRR